MSSVADDPEDLMLRLLQEIREDLRQVHDDLREQRVMLKDLKNRIDGNTVVLSMLAGMVHNHKQQIRTLGVR